MRSEISNQPGLPWTLTSSFGLSSTTSRSSDGRGCGQSGVGWWRSSNAEIGAITLRTMRAKLQEAAAIARAAEGLAADGQPGRALTMVLDVEPLAVEANQLLQGLAVLNRIARAGQESGGS